MGQSLNRNDPNYVYVYPTGCGQYNTFFPPQLTNVVTPQEWERTINDINGISNTVGYVIGGLFFVFFLGIILSAAVGGVGGLLFLVFIFSILGYICWYMQKKSAVTSQLNAEIYGGGLYWHSSKHSKYIQIHIPTVLSFKNGGNHVIVPVYSGNGMNQAVPQAHSANLPPGWEARMDPATNQPYWVDHNNQQSTWVDPRSQLYTAPPVSNVEAPPTYNDVTGSLPPGWRQATDPNSDATYYINDTMQKTQWERPT